MIMGGGSKGINMASNVLRTKEGAEATRVSKLADKLYNNTLSEDTATYLNYKKIAEKANNEGLPEV
jgi:NADH dehydrogenase FAD-containing subunit